jgi:uncharacterized protein involved in oxidation of intracellular sulfur
VNALLVLSEAPYGTDRVYNALRLAAALQARSQVRLFLMCDAVGAALDGQASPDPDQNLGARLVALMAGGARVKVCGLCLETRGMHGSKLSPGVEVGTMPELAAWIEESDRIVTL